jgi:RNA polymerase sigma-70 factor (ECF subfamily)
MAGPPASDSERLIERCQAGDRSAFRELFARHRADVTRLVFRMMGRRAEVDDLVQEVFLQVHRSLRDFRGDARFSTWLHRVTVNVVLMARRSAKSRPVFTEEPAQDLTRDDNPWPDEDAARRERMRSFQRCIDLLPEKKRTVFVLHELEGLPAAEISQIVDAPVLTVRTRLFYARKELAELMKKEPQLASFAAEFERGSKGDEPQSDQARQKLRVK